MVSPKSQHGVLSGKHTKNDGKSPCLMGKSTISMARFNSKLLVYQRVLSEYIPIHPNTSHLEIRDGNKSNFESMVACFILDAHVHFNKGYCRYHVPPSPGPRNRPQELPFHPKPWWHAIFFG